MRAAIQLFSLGSGMQLVVEIFNWGKFHGNPANFRITVGVVFTRVSKMNKYLYAVVVLAFMLTGCASVLPGKDKSQSQVTKNKIPPGYIQGSKGDSMRLRSFRFFGLGGSSDSAKPSGSQVSDPDYAEYLEWKRWQEFKAYQEWKAKKESQAQGS